MAYTYNADGKRANITYPNYQAFAYTYTGRNQLKTVGPWATYTYDQNSYTGDLTTRTLNNGNSGTQSTYLYDALDRVTWITHSLTGRTPGFNYGYDNVSVGNRKYIRRTGTTLGDKGDVFSYDLADQVSGVQLNVTSPQSTPSPPRSIFYDANGNRTTYAINNLNQYTSRNSNNATYNANGDITITPDPAGSRSTYDYDAQNRVLRASKGSTTMYLAYDGLNRQVSRMVGGVTTYNVWDGWDLIEEYQSNGTVTAKYVYGPSGLIKELVNNRYYYQDGSRSTSHIADSNGNLLEWYRYDLQGTPIFYDAGDHQLSASALGVRRLFTAQQWYGEVGLYDLRNRFYSPDIGRFLQPDPIGFRGDRTNLYRYCRNNPVTRWDPFGLETTHPPIQPGGQDYPPQTVWAPPLPGFPIHDTGFLPGDIGGWPGIPFAPDVELIRGKEGLELHIPDREPESPSVQHPLPSSVASQNPLAPADPYAAPNSSPATSSSFVILPNLPAFAPLPWRLAGIAIAYPSAHEVRIQGHHFFPGSVNSSPRHRWASRTLTREVGPTITRDLGILNEAQGFIFQDIPNLGSRLRGETAWAFDLRDLIDNEIGIRQAEFGDWFDE